jgi:hypothetical protein
MSVELKCKSEAKHLKPIIRSSGTIKSNPAVVDVGAERAGEKGVNKCGRSKAVYVKIAVNLASNGSVN